MVQGVSYNQLPFQVKPLTVYLALHQRPGDPLGDFDWSIVVTLDNEFSCVNFRASNTQADGLVEGEWHLEQTTPGQWTPATSSTLLCMFEIELYGRRDLLDIQLDRIVRTGNAFILRRSVSTLRHGQLFSSKTFALDVLAATTSQVAGIYSQLLESRATQAAVWTRIMAREEGKLMTAGWFKIFRMEIRSHGPPPHQY